MSAEINLINNLLVTAGANLSIEDLTGTVLVSDTPVLDNFHALKRLPTDFKYIQNNKYCQEYATTKKNNTQTSLEMFRLLISELCSLN